jgi:transcriptional regulator with GAF, ATPase, and Fis domain
MRQLHFRGLALAPYSSPSSSSLAVPTATVASTTRTLVDFDERLSTLAPGLVLARAPEGATAAVVGHALRRARASGAAVLTARPLAGFPMWQQIAERLAIGGLECEPSLCAEQILDAAATRRATLVLPLPANGTWDRAVTAEVSNFDVAGLVVLVGESGDAAADIRGDRYEIAAALDDAERRRWWLAVAEEGGGASADLDLGRLDAWWSERKRALRKPATERSVPDEGRDLLRSLALLSRAWPESDVTLLGGGLVELVEAGAVALDRGWVAVEPSWDDAAGALVATASDAERRHVAHLLVEQADEPWALARAAELFAGAGDAEAADDAFARAIGELDDATARREVVARWMLAVDSLPRDAQLELRCRAAERALAVGEADEACRWAKAALTLTKEATAERATVTLLLGRSAVALGDLTTAKVALERGRATTGDRETSATIAVELSEVHYLSGDMAAARREAEAAMDSSLEPETVLRARNTLGKLLLAEAKWEDADRHFAEDAQTATANGDRTAELRARLNRGIALLSKGLTDEARAMFESVLVEGERIGDARACAFALDNLAVLATWRHDYGLALALSERTLKLRQRLGDRLSMARILTNLAELRRRLGLLDHAEHAIAFGRRTLGPGMAIKGVSLSVIAARIALERGHGAAARREIGRAVVDCEAGGDRSALGEAHRVAARVALEDGDVLRAAEALARGRELATSDEARAEVAVLAGTLARAQGLPQADVLALAAESLAIARRSGKEELEREAHVLLAEVHRAAGETSEARAHVEQALALRDRMAEALPADVKAAFLAQPSIAALSRMRTQLADPTVPAPPESEDDALRARRSLRPTGGAPREIVGEDPAIRGLLAAIKKVARSSATVLIRGESGTGKELVAEALHRASERAAGPLVTVNCAALVETLLLSELFGHEKGAFTGAFARRRGRFELAEGGTLFLDEIGDISPRTQVALLRVLQERTFERVGGTTAIRANVRIVCATHRDLRAMVERGEFREDLYYRLRGITLEVPALRGRMGDLPRIAQSLLLRIAIERGEEQKSLSVDAIDLLGRHRWPGNVRELENALRAASLFAETSIITAADLAENVDDLRPLSLAAGGPTTLRPVPSFSSSGPSSGSSAPSSPSSTGPSSGELLDAGDDDVDGEPLPAFEANATQVAYAQVRQGAVSLSDMKRQIERDCIARALAETKGNITRAAALLGMKRPRLSQLVKQYGLAAVSSEAS